MMRVALSGGIASGKTTVSNALAEHGVPIIDTDLLAREVVEPDTVGLNGIVELFGESILNKSGALNRKKLRTIVFADDTARSDLEALLHPLIRDLTEAKLDYLEKINTLYVVVVIPLLIETNQQDAYDHIVIVDVEPEVQVQRVMARDKCSPEQAEKIIASQATRKERLAVADDVIFNSSTPKAVELQVAKIHARMKSLATKY